MIKISICIPSYNNLDSLKKCLESIFIQTFSFYEIIITDDSSNNIITDYIGSINNPKIKYFKNEVQLGSPENWNESIRKSSGYLIKIMHHDDWFTNQYSLQLFYDLITENNASLAFVASRNYAPGNKSVASINLPDIDLLNELKGCPEILIKGNFIGAPSATIFRKTDILFDVNLIWLVDIDLYIQILKKNDKIIYSNIDAVSIGNSENQITKKAFKDPKINIYEYFYLLNKYNFKRIYKSKFHHFTQIILKRFTIFSLSDLKSLYEGDLPLDIYKYFSLNQLFYRKISVYISFLKRFSKRKFKKIFI